MNDFNLKLPTTITTTNIILKFLNRLFSLILELSKFIVKLRGQLQIKVKNVKSTFKKQGFEFTFKRVNRVCILLLTSSDRLFQSSGAAKEKAHQP